MEKYQEKYEEWLNNPFFDKEVKEELLKIKDNEQIIYKNNQLMILKTKRNNNKLIYKYYDLDKEESEENK